MSTRIMSQRATLYGVVLIVLAVYVWNEVSYESLRPTRSDIDWTKRTTIEGTLARGLALLQEGDHKSFVVELTRASSLPRVLGNKSLRQFVERQRRSFTALEIILRTVSAQQPRLSSDGATAIYRFSEPLEGRSTFGLYRDGPYWYLW